MTPVYSKVNPMIYMYFASVPLVDNDVRSHILDAITAAEYALQALQTVLDVT